MAEADPRIGAVLDDRYRIVSVIASGSMGAIYRGERLKLGRAVAIKVLHTPLANQERFLQRFEVEAKALSRLGHPNCVSIIDFGVADAPYLVMEYINGRTLKELIDQRPLPAPRALHIFRQVLAGLAHAHGHGIVHRDVKPGNVMLTEATGTGDHIRILDFGLAKLHNAAMDPDETGSAKVIGTPSYMSPEQARGQQGDVRSDLYSAGVLLFEMLTGAKPFDSEEMLEVLNMQAEHPPPLLRSAAQGQKFSEELEAAVHKALAKRPERRYQTALEFAESLDRTPEAGQPLHRFHASVKPLLSDGTAELPLSEPRRSGARTWLVALLLLALAGGGGWYLWKVKLAAGGGGAVAARQDAAGPAPLDTAATGADAAPAPDRGTAAADAGRMRDAAPPDTAGPGEPDAAEPEENEQEAAADLPASGLARVRALIDAKRTDEAITELRKLRRRGKSAYIDYLLGKLYFDKRWWSVGMQHYREAMRKDRRYHQRAPMIRDLIEALVDRKTAARAEWMLVNEVGKAARPQLSRAARSHPLASVRKQAARVLQRLR